MEIFHVIQLPDMDSTDSVPLAVHYLTLVVIDHEFTTTPYPTN